jgi:hypothetical protein
MPKFNDDSSLSKPAALRVLPNVGGYSAVFMAGGSPSFVVKDASSLPRIVSLRGEGVRRLSGLNSRKCEAGFVWVDTSVRYRSPASSGTTDHSTRARYVKAKSQPTRDLPPTDGLFANSRPSLSTSRSTRLPTTQSATSMSSQRKRRLTSILRKTTQGTQLQMKVCLLRCPKRSNTDMFSQRSHSDQKHCSSVSTCTTQKQIVLSTLTTYLHTNWSLQWRSCHLKFPKSLMSTDCWLPWVPFHNEQRTMLPRAASIRLKLLTLCQSPVNQRRVKSSASLAGKKLRVASRH